MTESKTFKKRVRDRMSKTNESYTSARAQVLAKKERELAARSKLKATEKLYSDEAIKEGTGKTWDEWFAILDRWNATTKKHKEIAQYLGEVQKVSGWWSQGITVGYERARGMRLKYQREDGFSISTSKTINVSVDKLFAYFVEDRKRKKWLPDLPLTLRTSIENKAARFDWKDGSTRVNVGFTAKGPSKSMVAVAHERLKEAADVETTRAMWKHLLEDLKQLLEGKP